MSRRLIAVLLAFAWVSLTGFDLLEDLKLAPGDSAYAQSGKSHSAQWSRHHGLTNNIVESALSAHGNYAPLSRLNDSRPAIHPLSSLHRVLALHKLHRVFLI